IAARNSRIRAGFGGIPLILPIKYSDQCASPGALAPRAGVADAGFVATKKRCTLGIYLILTRKRPIAAISRRRPDAAGSPQPAGRPDRADLGSPAFPVQSNPPTASCG